MVDSCWFIAHVGEPYKRLVKVDVGENMRQTFWMYRLGEHIKVFTSSELPVLVHPAAAAAHTKLSLLFINHFRCKSDYQNFIDILVN